MNISIIAWSGLILALCATTFGLWWCITITVCIIIFLIGGMTPLYLLHWEAAQKYYTDLYRRKVQDVCPGLSKVTSMLDLDNDCLRKLDKRLTGAQAVDETLQEVLNLLLRDYLESWYNKVSSNPEFPYEVRKTIQKLAVNFSGRMKEVDWIPFLTTRLVDDAASHLRLFRQARAKLKQTHPTVASNSINQPESAATSSSGQEYVAKGSNIQSSSSTGNTSDLEGTFFDLEVTMEGSLLCRDLVCTDAEYEKQYLRDVAEVVLYLLLPAEDFQCKSLRFLLRELLVSSVILPVFTLFTDPDYINQIIIWLLCKEIPLTSEVFLTALRVTDNKDELYATRDLVTKEICQLRSRDSGGDDDTIVKQQLSSLLYLRKVVDSRLQRLKEGTDSDSAGLPSQLDWSRLTGTGIQSNRLFQLPLDVILKNNIALSYFIDYMTNIGAQAYLFFYLNVEGWRVSAEQQISDFELQKLGVTSAGVSEKKVHYGSNAVDSMREAAYSIFEQYLSEKASPRLRLDDSIVRKLLLRIRSETPYSETWFDEVQAAVYEKLQTEERFLPSFRSSVGYVRLLAELDLLKESCGNVGNSALLGTGEEEEDSAESSLSDNASLASFESDSAVAGVLADVQSIDVALPSIDTFSSDVIQDSSTLDEKRQGPSALLAEIIETGIVNDRGKTYGIYAVSVGRKYENTGHVDKWHVYRRYSDFHDLHSKIKEKYSDLAKLTFPGKKTFHNMERAVLEKRMKMLNDYLQILIQPGVISTHPLLKDYLASFLDQRDFGSTSGSSSSSGIGIGISGANIMTQTLDSLVVNPLRSSMRTVGQAVRTMPDNLLSTVDGVVDGLSKVFSGNQSSAQRPPGFYESMKVGASLHIETDDNIPLRIMLLLMDEVFDLKSRNQWLRRRIVTLLRQIIRTMFGDIVNRRILDYVSLMTSPEQVADYLRTFKHSLWPNGVRAEPKPPRDDATRMRTRVAAKVALLSSLSDELKHIIGSETARRGLLRVFELFQRPVLNRRLLHVLLEGVLQTLFPQHRLNHIFKTLHSRSGRVPNRGTDMVLRGEALDQYLWLQLLSDVLIQKNIITLLDILLPLRYPSIRMSGQAQVV